MSVSFAFVREAVATKSAIERKRITWKGNLSSKRWKCAGSWSLKARNGEIEWFSGSEREKTCGIYLSVNWASTGSGWLPRQNRNLQAQAQDSNDAKSAALSVFYVQCRLDICIRHLLTEPVVEFAWKPLLPSGCRPELSIDCTSCTNRLQQPCMQLFSPNASPVFTWLFPERYPEKHMMMCFQHRSCKLAWFFTRTLCRKVRDDDFCADTI